MEDQEILKLTVTDYIKQLSKELNINASKGLCGNELELIALVRNCQFLYDKNLADFKNIQKKNEAWETIGSVFGVTVGEVQQRWKSMRDLFNKQKNRVEGNSTNNKSLLCPYYDELKFLEPHIVCRRTRLMGISAISDQPTDEIKIKESSRANFDDLRLFVEYIKNAPVLYHRKYSGGSYGDQKIHEWRQIAKAFGVPVKECLARWRTLRERYSRERRMKNSGISMKNWEFFDALSFLDKHVKTRRRYNYSRMVPTTPTSSDQNICYVLTSPSTNSSSAPLDSPTFSNNVSSSTKKEIQIEEVEFFDVSSDDISPPALFNEENSVEVSELTNRDTETLQKPNEDDLFGQTIAAELKKISCSRKKIKLKADIYQLLYEHSCQ